jgi:acyl-coenzyme A thioesterase PaaI-like protein
MGSVRADHSIVVPSGPEAVFGVGSVDVRLDGVHGTMPLGPVLTGPDGRPSAGALGVLVDDVTGYAVIDGLVGGRWSVSVEIWLDMLAPLPATGSLAAQARVVHATADSAFTEGWVADDAGTRVAVCRQRGRAIGEGPEDLAPSSFALPQQPSDVADLIVLSPLDADSARLRVVPHLENPRRMLHGGVSLCASEVTAVRSRMAAGVDLPTSSVHIAHTRAIPAGSEVMFRARTRHAGRSFWVTEVTGWADGRIACVSTVSAQHL